VAIGGYHEVPVVVREGVEHDVAVLAPKEDVVFFILILPRLFTEDAALSLLDSFLYILHPPRSP